MEASTHHSCINADAKKAALRLGFGEPLSPIAYESETDEQLLLQVQSQAPAASREECLEAIARVRRLCALVYAFADTFHNGGFGEAPDARATAIKGLAARNPGFSESEYETAFAAGLIWTAF
jgi:hypothetical protein